jgi:hypothetical protein
MSSIRSDNKIHEAACINSEMLMRQSAMDTATTAAQVKAADVSHYRRIISSCKLNGLPFNEFTRALMDLGTGGQ